MAHIKDSGAEECIGLVAAESRVPALRPGDLLAVPEASRLAARAGRVGMVGPGIGWVRTQRCVRAVPRAPTCAVVKGDPMLANLAVTCGFSPAAGLTDPDLGRYRAQAEVVSGAPIAGESALTSGYLLVEARSPLPGAPRVSSTPS